MQERSAEPMEGKSRLLVVTQRMSRDGHTATVGRDPGRCSLGREEAADGGEGGSAVWSEGSRGGVFWPPLILCAGVTGWILYKEIKPPLPSPTGQHSVLLELGHGCVASRIDLSVSANLFMRRGAVNHQD